MNNVPHDGKSIKNHNQLVFLYISFAINEKSRQLLLPAFESSYHQQRLQPKKFNLYLGELHS